MREIRYENGNFTGTFVNTQLTAEGVVLTGSIDDWWDSNYPYRREILFNNNHSKVLTIVTLSLEIDHAALALAGKSRQDAADLRIVYQNGTELTEVNRIVTDENTTTCKVEFRLPETLPENSERISTLKRLYLYYGNLSASSPPCDADNVYVQYDHFDTNTSTEYETEENYGAWVYETQDSRIKASRTAGLYYMHKRKDTVPEIPDSYVIEMRFFPHWIVDSSNVTADISFVLDAGDHIYSGNTLDFKACKMYGPLYNTTSLRICLTISGEYHENGVFIDISDDEWHLLRIILSKERIILELDGHEYFFITIHDLTLQNSQPPFNYQLHETLPDWESTHAYLMCSCSSSQTYYYNDYYKICAICEDPPQLTLSAEQTQSSMATSGCWQSEEISPTGIKNFISLTVKADLTASSQAMSVSIDETEYPLSRSGETFLDLRGQSEGFKVMVSFAGTDTSPVLKSVIINYTVPGVFSRTFLGKIGKNLVPLNISLDGGVQVSFPNRLVSLPLPDVFPDVVQHFGPDLQTYKFTARLNVQDMERVRSFLGTPQTFYHNFLSDEAVEEEVVITDIKEMQEQGRTEAILSVTLVVM